MGEELQFERRHLRLVSRRRLQHIFQKEESDHEEQKQVYPLLPKTLRERYSLEEVIIRYQQSREAEIFRQRLRTVEGLYVPDIDRGYVLASLNKVRKTTVAVHELAHRAIHQQRKELRSEIMWTNQEEFLCGYVEGLFYRVVFSRGGGRNGEREIIEENQRDVQRIYGQVIHHQTSKKQVKQSVRELVGFYKELLAGSFKEC